MNNQEKLFIVKEASLRALKKLYSNLGKNTKYPSNYEGWKAVGRFNLKNQQAQAKQIKSLNEDDDWIKSVMNFYGAQRRTLPKRGIDGMERVDVPRGGMM